MGSHLVGSLGRSSSLPHLALEESWDETLALSAFAPALVPAFAGDLARNRASAPPTVITSSVTTTDSARHPLADSLRRTIERSLAADTTLRWLPVNAAPPQSRPPFTLDAARLLHLIPTFARAPSDAADRRGHE